MALGEQQAVDLAAGLLSILFGAVFLVIPLSQTSASAPDLEVTEGILSRLEPLITYSPRTAAEDYVRIYLQGEDRSFQYSGWDSHTVFERMKPFLGETLTLLHENRGARLGRLDVFQIRSGDVMLVSQRTMIDREEFSLSLGYLMACGLFVLGGFKFFRVVWPEPESDFEASD